ncbi:MAG: L,D-transpeptidase, partial [Thermoleophilaceae bacterium]
DASEVARQRTAAIDKLSRDLGAQGGADLGHILKELLEEATWEEVGGEPEPASVSAPSAEPAAEEDREPVQGVLSEPASDDPAPDGGRGRPPVAVGIVGAIAVLALAGVVYALTAGDRESSATNGSSASGTRVFAPQQGGAAEPFPSDPQSAYQYPTARVAHRTKLYKKPGGKVRLKISPKTEWDTPRVLGVVERRGKWLGVLVPELRNGQKAWVREDKVAKVSAVNWSLNADLSKRRMTVEHNGKTVRTMRIGVGRRDHSTPVGRYAVTDKLRVSDPSSPYGCCVLALSGHQTRLPAGWPGGDRLAVHATRDLSGLGKQVSLGCMRTDPRDTKWMLNRIPLGTPVFVRS